MIRFILGSLAGSVLGWLIGRRWNAMKEDLHDARVLANAVMGGPAPGRALLAIVTAIAVRRAISKGAVSKGRFDPGTHPGSDRDATASPIAAP